MGRSKVVGAAVVAALALTWVVGAGAGIASGGTSEPPGGGVQTDGFEALGEVTLTVMADSNDELTLERAKAIFEERYPNVTVEFEVRVFDDYMQVAPGILQSDDPPDVAHGNQGHTIDGLLVEAGLILPLTEYAEAYGWEDAFGSGNLDQYRFDETGTNFGEGTLWGVNPAAEIIGVFYNPEKLAAIGGEVPTTLDDFEALLAAAAEAGEQPIMLGNLEGWPALHVYGMLQAAYRPAAEIRDWVFGVAGSSVETEGDLAAAEQLVSWIEAGYLPEDTNGIGWEDGVTNFIDGEGVFLIGGNWNARRIEEGMGDNVGYFAFPVGPIGSYGGTGAMGLPWHISSQAEHPDLAAAFIALMVSEEFVPELVALGRVPARDASGVEMTGLIAETTAGAAQLIADDGLTLYADWATPTMFQTLTSKTQELLGGQIDAARFLADVQADWDAEFGE